MIVTCFLIIKPIAYCYYRDNTSFAQSFEFRRKFYPAFRISYLVYRFRKVFVLYLNFTKIEYLFFTVITPSINSRTWYQALLFFSTGTNRFQATLDSTCTTVMCFASIRNIERIYHYHLPHIDFHGDYNRLLPTCKYYMILRLVDILSLLPNRGVEEGASPSFFFFPLLY
jgi:hypothetical protein